MPNFITGDTINDYLGYIEEGFKTVEKKKENAKCIFSRAVKEALNDRENKIGQIKFVPPLSELLVVEASDKSFRTLSLMSEQLACIGSIVDQSMSRVHSILALECWILSRPNLQH